MSVKVQGKLVMGNRKDVGDYTPGEVARMVPSEVRKPWIERR